MEHTDRELILSMLEGDKNLRRLYKQHSELEKRLAEFEGRNFLTAEEEIEQRRLKKQKLHGVDKMMGIIQRQRDGLTEASKAAA